MVNNARVVSCVDGALLVADWGMAVQPLFFHVGDASDLFGVDANACTPREGGKILQSSLVYTSVMRV